MFIDGGNIWEIFFSFCKWVLLECEDVFPNKRICLVFDNASCHLSAQLKENFLNEINYLTTPPYSPQLTPIELLFAYIKKKFRENTYNNKFEIKRGLSVILKNIKSKIYRNNFYHTLKYMKKSLAGEAI